MRRTFVITKSDGTSFEVLASTTSKEVRDEILDELWNKYQSNLDIEIKAIEIPRVYDSKEFKEVVKHA